MFLGFGLAGVVELVGVVVVFGAVIDVDEAGVVVVGVLFVGAETADPVAAPAAFVFPDVGVVVVVGVEAGTVVNGVGSGGNGFAITPAIISVSPASESL